MPEPAHPVINAATKLADCTDAVLRMTCSRCRRESALAVQDVARVHGRNLKLWRMVERLRCGVCGAVPAMVELIEGIETARSIRAVKTIRFL
jgi:hypothetical protein